jgi:hypothetical protein
VATVQYTFTHKQYKEYRDGTYITINRIGKCGPCPVFASYALAFALQLRKKHGKTSVRAVEKCPVDSSPVHIYTQTQSNTMRQNTQNGT